MTEPRFTPGPWTTEPKMHRAWICTIGNNANDPAVFTERVAAPGESYQWGDKQADAHLIAAAPDLYEALHYAETVMLMVQPRSHTKEYLACLEQAKAALRKARGEP